MRKAAICLTALLFVCLTGCSGDTLPTIEEYDWKMTSVQNMDANGQVIAYGERGSSTLDTAKQIELTCEAKQGCLTLTDKTNQKTYTGTYRLSSTDLRSSIYGVTVDGTEGAAVTAMTTYQDDSKDPTLIIRLGDYTINFFAEEQDRI